MTSSTSSVVSLYSLSLFLAWRLNRISTDFSISASAYTCQVEQHYFLRNVSGSIKEPPSDVMSGRSKLTGGSARGNRASGIPPPIKLAMEKRQGMVARLPRWLRGSNNHLKESIASCPKCLTLETLWFWRNRLEPTKRFTQKSDGKVYHDCGSLPPCRLFTAAYRDRG